MIKNDSSEKRVDWISSALKVNLERTAVTVEIPEKYAPLLDMVKDHYGLQKKARELLIELNHPFVNWDYVLNELKTLSTGDFYMLNRCPDALQALSILLCIYYDIIKSSAAPDIRETAVRYLFDFVETILSQSHERLPANISLLPGIIESLMNIAGTEASTFSKGSTYGKRILPGIIGNDVTVSEELLESLFHRLFRITYEFWLTQPDPAEWFAAGEDEAKEPIRHYVKLIEPISHHHLRMLLRNLDTPQENWQNPDDGKGIKRYLQMPDYFQIVNGYLLLAEALAASGVYEGRRHLVKLDFLFDMMGVPGLSDIHGETLREINRCLKRVFQEEKKENLNDLVKKIFSLLKKSRLRHEYRGAVLDCISTMSREVFEQNNHSLAETFIEELIAYGFQYPDIKGSTTEWQVQVNPAHLLSIRSWLEIIAKKPRWTKKLLSALIINLKIGGIFIRDTDLMQKDVSALLAADIAPAYNLVKQVLRIFPIYFNEIGAEGELRDISTKVDDLSARNDKLVNFLRKQSHVDSNSLLVGFMEDIFQYWLTGNKVFVQKHLPVEVYEQVVNEGEYFDGMQRAFQSFLPKIQNNPRKLLEWDRERVQKELHHVRLLNERDKDRVELMIRLYQLLYKKYYPQYVDLLNDLESIKIFPKSEIDSLKRALRRKNHFTSIKIIIGFLSILKARILSPKPLQFFENIYYKRHIAAGIPSMYGTYYEEKFEAFGLSLRLESLTTMLFEEMIASMNLKFITKKTIIKIHSYLWTFVQALELEGIAIEGLVARLKYITSALPIKQFSIDQYIDIFRFISKGIQDVIRDYYVDAHSTNLPVIIKQVMRQDTGGGAGPDARTEEQAIYQHSENFIRGMISSCFGLQVLDNFVNSVIGTLNAEVEKFKDNKEILSLVMDYNPEHAISVIYKKNKRLDNQILLGNKGFFLKELVSFGFRVPPGFIITTEVFRGFDAVYGYKYIFKDLAVRVSKEIAKLEKMTGCRFGDRYNPLLLSVRSGATISLPGMMQSFLNVGINESIAESLSHKEGFQWAAWDCYRRFLQTWGMFQGLNRDYFDVIMDSFKRKFNVAKKIRFLPEQMIRLALAYKQGLVDNDIAIIDEPYEQLRRAIQQVFGSWYSAQARIYRHQMHLSDEWGTAVIVQAMVFGNLNEHSGSGVIFTRDPKGASSDVALYGDFIFGVQGHDIVSGLVETHPISEKQRTGEYRDSGISLETKFPEIYAELVRLSEILIYEKGFNHQEIEFTFESPSKDRLWILQTRDMVQIKTKRLSRFKDDHSLQTSLLGTGIGVSGGALCGRVVYSESDIRRFRDDEPETPLILLRPDTVPDDVSMLLQVEGLLTAKGGATSHAAVTIPQLNKVGVVGFSKLKVYETDGYAVIDGRTIRTGDLIGIDGWSGSVYEGRHERESEESYHAVL